MAFFPQPRRYTHSGFPEDYSEVREERRKSTSNPFSFDPTSFNTMEEAAARWTTKLNKATGKRQQSRAKFWAAAIKHSKICEQMGPLAMKDRVLHKLRRNKENDGPLCELEQIRKELATLAIEQQSSEDLVECIIRGFKIYANQVLHHFQRQTIDPTDWQARLDHNVFLAHIHLIATNIYYDHYFGERACIGDTAKLLDLIWQSESILNKKSTRTKEAYKIATKAEIDRETAEAQYQRVYEQQSSAITSWTTALSHATSARRLAAANAHAEAVARWVLRCRTLFTNYAALETFPEPPQALCNDEDCTTRQKGRALDVCECSVREAVAHLGAAELKWMRIMTHPDKFSGCDEERREVFKRKAHEVNVVVNEIWTGERERVV